MTKQTNTGHWNAGEGIPTDWGSEIERAQKRAKEPLRSRSGPPTGQPSTDIESVPTSAVRVNERLFQPRALHIGKVHEDHVHDLVGGLRARGELEPLIVFALGTEFIVIDGHHRLAAYRREKRPEVPVRRWTGNVKGAVMYSRSENSKATRALSASERSENAWQMVLTAGFKNIEVVAATNTGRSTVKAMKKAASELGNDAARMSWRQARARLGERFNEEDPEYTEELLDAKARELWEKFNKKMGLILLKDPELFVRALQNHAPSTAARIFTSLREARGEPMDDDE